MAAGAGRYDEILEAFTRHIAEIGYDGTNFGSVARELGLSKGTIVHHFGSKDRILAAIHENYMTERLRELDEIFEALANPAERLAAALYASMIYQVRERPGTIAFQREVVRLADEETMARARVLRSQYFGKVRDVVASGVESKIFRDVDVRIDTLLVFGASQWAWTWFHPDGDRSAEEVGSSLVDLVLGGLLVERHHLAELADPSGHAATVAAGVIAGGVAI